MKNGSRHTLTLIAAALTMLLLIFDAKTALNGARDGINIVIHTVIPSLFPFLFIATILNHALLGTNIPFIGKIGALCGVPKGAESLLMLGLLGGYPVGAQMITDCYHTGQLDKHNAHRMLGFCNNAGPGFLFGMLSSVYTNPIIPFILWMVHILSALITGILLPGRQPSRIHIRQAVPLSMPSILEKTLKSIAGICGWVILFKVFVAFCMRWFLWRLPTTVQIMFVGFLELSNGCISLQNVPNDGIRIILGACMLAFGGLCVGMQTISATTGLGQGLYFHGKVLQTAISFLLITPVALFLYRTEYNITIKFAGICAAAIIVSFVTILIFCRKKVAFHRSIVYNVKKRTKRG